MIPGFTWYSYIAKKSHIQVVGLIESTGKKKDATRPMTVKFGIPVDVSGNWTWGSGLSTTVTTTRKEKFMQPFGSHSITIYFLFFFMAETRELYKYTRVNVDIHI